MLLLGKKGMGHQTVAKYSVDILVQQVAKERTSILTNYLCFDIKSFQKLKQKIRCECYFHKVIRYIKRVTGSLLTSYLRQ